MELILHIRLGNAEMLTGHQVGEAVEEAGRNIAARFCHDEPGDHDGGTIWDANGNRVGEWDFREER